jgi:SAM-dependent methyltransferase
MSYYGQSIGWIRCALNYGREQVADFCRQAPAYRSVLDIGAGPGEDLFAAGRIQPGAALHAVEVNSESADRLRERGVSVYPINIERQRIPTPDCSIDLVIMNQVLEHVKDIYWVFHEVTRVLPVGGSLILGVPNLASLHNRILLGFGLQPTCIKSNSAHVRGFTRGDILQFLQEVFPTGYQLKGFRGSNFYPFPPAPARLMARVFPTLAWGMFMRLEKRRSYRREFLDAPVIQELETNYFLGKNEDCPDTRLSF